MSEASTQTRKWVEVAAADDVGEGQASTFTVEAHRVAVARANGQLYAVQDLCTHDDGPLGEGELEGFAIQCPRHGARFDIRSGAVLRMPAVQPIETFPVMEKEGKILIAIPEGEDEAAIEDGDW